MLDFSLIENFTPEAKKLLVLDIENEIFSKNTEVDHFYKKKISDTCENIKLIKDYRDIADLIFVKKTVPLFRIFSAHP